MAERKKVVRESLTNLIRQVDAQPKGKASPDSVPTGFPSVDKMLGGGFRRRDLIALGGDVGSGKSALALSIALRTARAGFNVVFFSGEMDADRLMERALAIEGRAPVDDMRNAALTDQGRAGVGAAALRIRDLPLSAYALTGQNLDEALAAAWRHDPAGGGFHPAPAGRRVPGRPGGTGGEHCPGAQGRGARAQGRVPGGRAALGGAGGTR
ncbi:MAG: hypothetical protein EXR93_06565 [Gemmatimonadetes bacterium]|nr:hypothetical protein [Gemmatimonadota bacterium]